ncbi:MAG: hypothetical protein IJ733_20435, partial [Lachnospiraceae bacterium]|nr:hypothetical protein [Lachnospiraceae bacterium]
MESEFAFIKEIQDEAFLEHFKADDGNRGLYERCIEIVKDYQDSRFDNCLTVIRPLYEKLIKYVYYRLFGEEWRESGVFILVGKNQEKVNREIENTRNPKKMQEARKNFRERFTDTFLDEADVIRDQGNEAIHNGKKETDQKREARRAIDSLAYLIVEAVKIIENSEKTDGGKESIEGIVKIEQKLEDDGN